MYHDDTDLLSVYRNESISNEPVKWSVTGHFKKGKRQGFCSFITKDAKIKGYYNKNGHLTGYGTAEYLSEGIGYLIYTMSLYG